MGKGQKLSWTFIFGIVIQFYFASVLATSEVAFRKDGVDPNYASLLKECKKIKLPDGTMIQTVPKLLQTPLITACSTWKSKYGPPLTQAVCRFPDCLSNPCQYGWCEETLQGYQCLCFPGFRGKHCAERWTLPTDGTTESLSGSSQSVISPTSTSGLPITTASTAPTGATTITPSDSTLQATSPTSTSSMSSPTSTTASSAPTDATTITPSDSALPVGSSTSTSRPPTPRAKVFVTDREAGAIFISDLRDELSFTSIPSTSSQNFIKYDPTERHIYWSDWDEYCVYRANLDGTNREQVTAAGANERISAIAIAERSRILYIAYYYANKVTSMSIERGSPLPGTETDFVNQDIYLPVSLVVDEEEGFLYISRRYGIVRALLNAASDIEEIYHNTDLLSLYGLSIDLTKNPRRIFFLDWGEQRTFYKDLSSAPNSDVSIATELTNYMHPYQENLRDIIYFDGILYWVKGSDPMGIGFMTNYDQTNRSYRVQEIGQFQDPRRILIISIEP